MHPKRLLDRLRQGRYRNISFSDLCRLLGSVGFELDRIRGSHYVFVHREARVRIALQSARGEAKPYQARQVLKLIERYNLSPEEKP